MREALKLHDLLLCKGGGPSEGIFAVFAHDRIRYAAIRAAFRGTLNEPQLIFNATVRIPITKPVHLWIE
jgi:hypothetical protein